DHGANWVEMAEPETGETTGFFNVLASGQGFVHFSMVADPYDTNIVYIGGDTQPGGGKDGDPPFPNSVGANQHTARLLRGDFKFGQDQRQISAWEAITDRNTSNQSSPHADSRGMVFQGLHLIEVDDGGI